MPSGNPNPNLKNFGFGTRPKEEDDKIRAMGLEARRTNPRVWTDEKIAEFIDDLLTVYKRILIDADKIEEGNPKRLKQETIMDLNTMVNRLLKFKMQYYPPVQKNINVNIDVTANEVIERLKNWKKKQKEEPVIVDIVSEDKNG